MDDVLTPRGDMMRHIRLAFPALLVLVGSLALSPVAWSGQGNANKPAAKKQVKQLNIDDVKAQIGGLQKAIQKLSELSSAATSSTVKGDIEQAMALRASQLELLQRQEKLLEEIAQIEKFRDVDAKDILTNEEKDQYTKQASNLRDQLSEPPADPPANPAPVPPATLSGTPRSQNADPPNNVSPSGPAAPGDSPDNTPPPQPVVQTPQEPGGEFTRAIVGYEQAGASAAAKKQNVFIDLFFGTPISDKKYLLFGKPSRDYDFGPRWRSWGDIRLSSVPLQNTAGNITVSNFVNGGFTQQVGALHVNEVVQAAEFLAGFEVLLGGIRRPLPSFATGTKEKFTFSFFVGGGAITPVTPLDSRQVFVATSEAINTLNLPSATQFIAFVNPDRDRFFRQYYGGLRLKTHYLQDCTDLENGDKQLTSNFHCMHDSGSSERLRQGNRFPATLDIGVGQNESVTAGRLHGAILRVDGFFPLPWEKGQSVYLFGTALMKPRKAIIKTPLVLAQAPDSTAVPGPNVAIVPIDQIDRDYYRIGVGVDLIGLIKTFVSTPKKGDAVAPSPSPVN